MIGWWRWYFPGWAVGVGRHREHYDEAAWERTVVSFMVFFCFAFIEQLWGRGT
jgi:hypothetical protein